LISNRFAVKYNGLLTNFFYGFAPLGKPISQQPLARPDALAHPVMVRIETHNQSGKHGQNMNPTFLCRIEFVPKKAIPSVSEFLWLIRGRTFSFGYTVTTADSVRDHSFLQLVRIESGRVKF
jgi:hypothetical protein